VEIYPAVAACLNMDMVGRLRKALILQGIGSSSIWRGEIERRNVPVGLPITLQEDSYLPTDASTFYMRGVPILSAFTGSHSEYHTPRDTPDTLNYDGASKVSRLMALIARSLATRESAPDYVAQTGPKKGQRRANLRAYLGTIPDYAESDVPGVKLSGVAQNGPAAKAGIQGGDVIVELAGKKIDNIYDYTYAIEALKIGQEVSVVVQRGDRRITLKITPGSRE
jgi:C-terminal processing protease CtpA/Prc